MRKGEKGRGTFKSYLVLAKRGGDEVLREGRGNGKEKSGRPPARIKKGGKKKGKGKRPLARSSWTNSNEEAARCLTRKKKKRSFNRLVEYWGEEGEEKGGLAAHTAA